MERRGFLKALGTGIVGAVVAPLGDAKADQHWITTDEGLVSFIRGRSQVGWMPMRYQEIYEFQPITNPFSQAQKMQDMMALQKQLNEYRNRYINSYKIGYDPARGVEFWEEASDILVPVTATEVATLQQEALMRTTNELFQVRAAIAGSFVSERLLSEQIKRSAGLAPGTVLSRRDERGHGVLEFPDGDVS